MEKCNFECANLMDGECQVGGGECIRDCCPNWMDCDNCKSYEDCDL